VVYAFLVAYLVVKRVDPLDTIKQDEFVETPIDMAHPPSNDNQYCSRSTR